MPLLVLLSWLALVVAPAAAEEVIPAGQAREFADQWITVEGKVMPTRTEGRNTFLSIGPPALPDLTVVVRPPLLSDFPAQPGEFYGGKTVRASGKIYIFRGRPEMIVTDSNLIEVVGAKVAAAEEPSGESVAVPTPEIREETVAAKRTIPDTPVPVLEASVETAAAEPAELEIEAVPPPAAESSVNVVEPEPQELERPAAAEPVAESGVETIEVEEHVPEVQERAEAEPAAQKEEQQALPPPAPPTLAPVVPGQTATQVDVPSPEAEEKMAAPATSDPCGEAQMLWREVAQDLIPYLRAYAACLEKGMIDCEREGEKAAMSMLAIQQAQKRVKTDCE